MKAREQFIFILLAFCMLCGCGSQAEDTGEATVTSSTFQPVLNENGREEIYLSAISLNVTMQEIIVDYNRQSDRYEVVPLVFDRETSVDDQRNRIQLEVTSGGGPDILSATALQNIDMRPYAEAGVLLDVTDFLAGQGEFVKNVAEANRVEARMYGIPYSFSLNTMVTSPMMATDRENWTMEYCVQTAQNAGITTFIAAPYGWTSEESGANVLSALGVGKDGIQLFVDEEQGISSFDKPEFIALLEFAKKYSDPEPEASNKGKYASGEIFCTIMGFGNFESFWYCDKLFEGEYVCMGYPSPQGGQHEIMVDSFYINAASSHVEGALNFMEYLLEDEQQRRLVAGSGGFPVKQELLERIWKEAKDEVICDMAYEKGDVHYAARLMTDEEEQCFWEMLEHPMYYRWQNKIDDIIWDEALPFFCGDKSAEEAAKIIDSKVQLYLDEKK